MLTLYILLLGVVVATLAITQQKLSRQRRNARCMAQTGSLPAPMLEGGFLGIKSSIEAVRALKDGSYFPLVRKRFAQNGRTFQGLGFGQSYLITSDVENVRTILWNVGGFHTTGRRADYWPLLRGGILLSSGPQWRASRSIIQPAMARSRVNDATYLEDRVVELIERLPKDGSTVDLQEYFQRLTFDSAIDYLCGERLDSDQEAEAKVTIRSHFHTAMIEIGRRSKLGFICQLDMFTRPKGFYRYIRSALAMNHYFEKLVTDRSTRLAVVRERNEKESERLREEFQPEPFVFLDHLAEATTDHGQIKWELATAVAAGRDTTASLMAHVFWELSRRDEVWRNLQQEVQMLNGSAPTFADLDKMLYLKAVVKEALRMYSSIPNSNRWATHDLILPRGGGPDGQSPCFVPAGQRILIAYHAIHFDPDIWGPDADEFKPERWLVPDTSGGGGKVRLLIPAKDTYVPFSSGPRNCPGQHYVFKSVSYTMVRMLQSFGRIESRDERPYAAETSVSIAMKHGTLVGLYPS